MSAMANFLARSVTAINKARNVDSILTELHVSHLLTTVMHLYAVKFSTIYG
jgi:hypothetical protein